MPTRQDLKALARLRLREAEVLFGAGLYDGAAYLGGYGVELALKARICRLLGLSEYPDTGELKRVYAVHDLDQLLTLAGLKPKVSLANANLQKKWSTAVKWKAEQRYDKPGTMSRQDAHDMLEAIRDRRDGVLTWIKKHW